MLKNFLLKIVFVETRRGVPSKRSFLNFLLFRELHIILYGFDEIIKEIVNRCAQFIASDA